MAGLSALEASGLGQGRSLEALLRNLVDMMAQGIKEEILNEIQQQVQMVEQVSERMT